jgi:hypothetical protein
MLNHKELSLGCFDSLNSEQKEFIMECKSWFHFMNGKTNPDGSRGEIKITPGELNNLLAYTLKHNQSTSPKWIKNNRR